jgi:protein-tyrosine phosphatase
VNDSSAARGLLVDELNARLGGTPAVLPGCEYFFGADALGLAEDGENGPLTGLGGSRYLLVEFAASWVPPDAELVLHELVVLGTTPVIAHPERNLALAREPARLERFVDIGAAVQVTAGSLLGDFGRPAKAFALDLVRRGLAHVVASDAHSVDRRPPRQSAARELVRKTFGAEVEARLFDANPGAIVRSEALV